MPQKGKMPQKYTHMVPKCTFALAFQMLYGGPVKLYRAYGKANELITGTDHRDSRQKARLVGRLRKLTNAFSFFTENEYRSDRSNRTLSGRQQIDFAAISLTVFGHCHQV